MNLLSPSYVVQVVNVLVHMLKGNTQRLWWPGPSSQRASLLLRGWRSEFLEAELIEESTARLGFSGLRDPGSVRVRPPENMNNNSRNNMKRD